jgi:hypothetical protein
MAENNFVNDPELSQLERRLMAVAIAPEAHNRDRLLYACGEAAGRARMRRRVQAATAVAVTCLCVSAGLSFVLIARSGEHEAEQQQAARPNSNEELDAFKAQRPRFEQLDPDGRRPTDLTAAMSFQQFLAFNAPQPSNHSDGTGLAVPSKRILSAADLSLPDDL